MPPELTHRELFETKGFVSIEIFEAQVAGNPYNIEVAVSGRNEPGWNEQGSSTFSGEIDAFFEPYPPHYDLKEGQEAAKHNLRNLKITILEGNIQGITLEEKRHSDGTSKPQQVVQKVVYNLPRDGGVAVKIDPVTYDTSLPMSREEFEQIAGPFLDIALQIMRKNGLYEEGEINRELGLSNSSNSFS